jgi:hypothetical protein
MDQLRYVGSVAKTLIDVAPLKPGETVITVEHEFAERLLKAFPDEYEVATESATKSKTPQKDPPDSNLTDTMSDSDTEPKE